MSNKSNKNPNFEKYAKEMLRMYKMSNEGNKQNLQQMTSNTNTSTNQNTNKNEQNPINNMSLNNEENQCMNNNLNAYRELNDNLYINSSQEMQNNENTNSNERMINDIENSNQETSSNDNTENQYELENNVSSRRIDKSQPPTDDDIKMYEARDKAASMPQNYESYEDFLEKNPSNGFIKAQVFKARGALPVSNVDITIYKDIAGQRHVFHTTQTDESGNTSPMAVPTPELDNSFTPGGKRAYQIYSIEAKKQGYITEVFENLTVFPGVVSIQPIALNPIVEESNNRQPEVIVEDLPQL